MLVNFKREFFGPGGVLYQKGTQEYNGDPDLLPTDALVVSEKGTLPVRENTPKAGHGAKPLEEQVLDMIPGAGKTHQIDVTPAPDLVLTDAQREEKEKEAAKVAADDEKAKAKADDAEAKDLKESVEKALPAAEKAAEAVAKATDPLDILKDPKGKK